MWVGNVPSDATIPELWTFFSVLQVTSEPTSSPSVAKATTPPIPPIPSNHMESLAGGAAADTTHSAATHGILSIFIITRSNCAFVNYVSAEALQQAVTFFTGKSLRPHDPHCPRLVCRVRKKDEEVQAGVAGQRGKGYHIAYVKEHERKKKEDDGPEPVASGLAQTSRPSAHTRGSSEGTNSSGKASSATAERPPLKHDPSSGSLSGSSGSISYTSTNSSVLRHPAFKERFFILKSHSLEELERSVKEGTWATQPHNEDVLDQAFRNSRDVFLIFSANQSGEWFGVARMASSIKAQKVQPVPEGSPLFARRQVQRPATIVEEDGSQGSATEHDMPIKVALASPLPMEGELGLGGSGNSASGSDRTEHVHPVVIEDAAADNIKRKDMLGAQGPDDSSISSISVTPSESVSMGASSSKDMQQLAVRALIHNLRLDERESSLKAAELEQILQSGSEGAAAAAARAAEPLGKPFRVEWLHVKPVTFHTTRKLRNPWRDNRQVKVSRDGTELEPGVGRELLELLKDAAPVEATIPASTTPAVDDPEQEDD